MSFHRQSNLLRHRSADLKKQTKILYNSPSTILNRCATFVKCLQELLCFPYRGKRENVHHQQSQALLEVGRVGGNRAILWLHCEDSIPAPLLLSLFRNSTSGLDSEAVLKNDCLFSEICGSLSWPGKTRFLCLAAKLQEKNM